MALTAISGPQIVYGDSSLELNQDLAPSLFFAGEGFVDVRDPFKYLGVSTATPKVYGFPQNGFIQTLNANIYSTNTIAVAAPSIAATPLVLATVSTPGMTVDISVRESSTGKIVIDTIALDDFHTTDFNGIVVATTALSMGQSGNIACWDPATLSSRRLDFAGGSVSNTFHIQGIDIYGFFVSETLVTVGVGPFFSAKAYKYIISITPSVSDATGMTITTANQIEFPLRYDYPGTTLAYENGVLNAVLADLESSLYTITNIVPALGILTITIAGASFGGTQAYTIPVNSKVTLVNVNPFTYNGIYTVLTSAPGTFTVASVNVDVYVSGGNIFCDTAGPNTNDVRGVYNAVHSAATAYQLILYQAISLPNMITNIGQFGVLQFGA